MGETGHNCGSALHKFSSRSHMVRYTVHAWMSSRIGQPGYGQTGTNKFESGRNGERKQTSSDHAVQYHSSLWSSVIRGDTRKLMQYTGGGTVGVKGSIFSGREHTY